jgi:hypothetical protein
MTGEKTASTFRQVFGGKDEPLDSLSGHNRFDDLWHIRHRNPAVKKMIGLDQDADATRALVKTARSTNARGDFVESAQAELFLQRPVHLFRTSSRA